MLEQLDMAFTQLTPLSVFLRLFMAVVCGGIIGIDRGRKRRAAGLRTHMLVCLGSTLAMVTNQYLTIYYPSADPARLGAQVISGIGFLGAGTILVTRHQQVVGLTTAAGLWASACMGLAIGVGFYWGAIIACGFIIFTIIVMHSLDNRVMLHSRVMEIYVEINESGSISELLSYMANHGIKISYMEIVGARPMGSKGTAALLTIKLPKKFAHSDVIQGLSKVDGVAFLEEV